MIVERIQNGLFKHYELTKIMEKMAGDLYNRTNEDICLDEVHDADLYILLIGKRYGSHPPKIRLNENDPNPKENTDCTSYTEIEYNQACKTFNGKFYGILKFEFTDEFFINENLPDHSDLDDPEKSKRYNRFLENVRQGSDTIKVKSLADLQTKLNNLAFDFIYDHITKLELNLSLTDKIKIDRTEQISITDKIKFEGGSYVFLVEGDVAKDGFLELMGRVQMKYFMQEPKPDFRLFSISEISQGLNADREKILERILKDTSMNIYGKPKFGMTFPKFPATLNQVQNVFIGFLVNPETDLREGLNYVELIAAFISRIDEILKSEEFDSTFVFMIYINSPISQANTALIARHFEGLRFIPMGRLKQVTNNDATVWLAEIKDKTDRKNENDLFKFIFLSPEAFPTDYNNCIKLIDKRTK